jgi:glycosyltransferase involved in cell wall biosynthesis
VFPDLVRGRFDAVHSLMPRDAVAAIRARRVTSNVTVYDEMGVPYRRNWAGMRDGAARRRVMKDTDVYGCMSRFALDVFEAEWGRDGVIIPGGVRLSQFAPAAEREPVPTILFSAALTLTSKRLDFLLEALALVAERVPDAKLWLSGPGDPSAILAAAPEAARSRTELLPLGQPEDQGDRYARAWVTVLPTETDSFGLVTLEALASGTPIVVTDRGAPPELIRPGIGFACDADSVAALADGIVQAFDLARDPATAARCRERAAAFDWDLAIAPLLEELYVRPVTAAASGTGTTTAP